MSSSHLLTPVDYCVVATTLAFSSAIGIYHGLINAKARMDDSDANEEEAGQEEEEEDDERGGVEQRVREYFLAGRTMSLIPVALSFFATANTTLGIVGLPLEIYAFGLMFYWYAVTLLPVSLLIAELFVPLFYNMGSINIFKFLELRYNRRMKEVVTILATLRAMMFGSTIVYATAVCFNQVTNIDQWIIIGTITGVCIIYTSLGGIRGVIWADVLQGIIMLSALIILVVVGIHEVGGPSNVFNSVYDTGRMDIFVFDLDPRTRHTFWSDFVGMFVVVTSYFVTSQANIHRLLTAPSVDVAKRSSYLGFSIQFFLTTLSALVGCIMYAAFYRCDPLTAKTVKNMNQLLPLFVSNVLGPYPVLPGLFFAGILSACLSTMSSVFNSFSAILMETFVEPHFPKMSAKLSTNVCRLLGIFVGLLNAICIVIAERFPNVTQAAISGTAAIDGPFLGIIVIGIFAPQANVKVVAAAFLGGFLSTLWIYVGGLLIRDPLKMKPMFSDGCSNHTTAVVNFAGVNYANTSQFMYSSYENHTITISEHVHASWEKYFPLHGVTFQWLAAIGLVVFLLLFVVLSLLFGKDERSELKFNPADFIPKNIQRFQRRLPKTLRRIFLCDVYEDSAVKDEQILQLNIVSAQ